MVKTGWECLVKPGKKCPIGQVIEFDDRLSGTVIDKTEFGGRIIEFTCNGVFDDVIQEIGEMPLPPYIHEKLEDKDRYQTVYAKGERFCCCSNSRASLYTRAFRKK